MTEKNPHRPFTPDPEMLAARPAIAGNEINGVGETAPRRPRMVFWAPNPDDIAFGDVQKWFYSHETDDPRLHEERARRRAILEAPLPDLAPTPVERAPKAWTAALDDFVADGWCERVGATEMRPEWVFQHHDVDFKTVVVLGVQHDYERLKSAPDVVAGADVTRQYSRAAAAAKEVAGWIRRQGWDAQPVTGPMVGEILLIPPALECGFGELGKHGSLINPEFGSAFRLGAVLTNAPFAATQRRTFGVDEFCRSCRVCEDTCPPIAIAPDKQMVRGEERWYVDFDKCIPYFAETSGCAICIAVCPWSRPGVGLNLAAKLARRAERLEQTSESAT
ncbi:MAG: 4Fe-4S dicluster domain-containing protein [Pseudomonadota bacterium]